MVFVILKCPPFGPLYCALRTSLLGSFAHFRFSILDASSHTLTLNCSALPNMLLWLFLLYIGSHASWSSYCEDTCADTRTFISFDCVDACTGMHTSYSSNCEDNWDCCAILCDDISAICKFTCAYNTFSKRFLRRWLTFSKRLLLQLLF